MSDCNSEDYIDYDGDNNDHEHYLSEYNSEDYIDYDEDNGYITQYSDNEEDSEEDIEDYIDYEEDEDPNYLDEDYAKYIEEGDYEGYNGKCFRYY